MHLSDQLSKESGVSPVIGVMLILVVTIIIAAVVSAFAAGLSDTSVKTPVASFEFKVYSNYQAASYGNIDEGYLEATMKSGQTIDTSDLKIVSYHEDENGNLAQYEFEQTNISDAGSADWGKNKLNVFRVQNFGYNVFGYDGTYWHTGEKFSGGAEYVLNVAYPQAGDKIEVNMVYKPTNAIIWSDEVTVI